MRAAALFAALVLTGVIVCFHARTGSDQGSHRQAAAGAFHLFRFDVGLEVGIFKTGLDIESPTSAAARACAGAHRRR